MDVNITESHGIIEFTVAENISVGVSYRSIERNRYFDNVLHKVGVETDISHIVEFPVSVYKFNQGIK